MKKLFITIIFILCSFNAYALNVVEFNPQYYPNPTKGRPLSLGSIYIGEVDLDPEIVGNQKTLSVRQEDGSVVTVTQPVSTNSGGVPTYNGSTVTLLVDGNYSLKVLDSAGTQVYYMPSNLDTGSTPVSLSKYYGCDLLAALSDIGTTDQMQLNVDCSFPITTNTTITSNITLKIEPGAIITIATGIKLIIDGGLDVLPRQYAFNCVGTGAVVAGTNSLTSIVYPEWWGALGDNDATGTRPAINGAAVASAEVYLNGADEGGTIYFSVGIYQIGGDYILSSNTRFLGAGRDLTKIVLVDDGNMSSLPVQGWIYAHTAAQGAGVGNNITIEGIHFDSTDFVYTDDFRVIWTSGKDNMTVKDCRFTAAAAPVHLRVDGDNYRVTGNEFLVDSVIPGSPCLVIGGTNVFISNNYFDSATMLSAGTNDTCTINIIDSQNVLVTENIIGASYSAAVLVEGNTVGNFSDNVKIMNNIIDYSDSTEITVQHAVFIQLSKRVDVIGNTFIGTKTHIDNTGVRIIPDADSHGYLKKIHGNTFQTFEYGVRVIDSGAAPRLYLDDLSIKDNRFDDINSYDIYLLGDSVSGAKDYLITIDANELKTANHSMYINLTEDIGELAITNNNLHGGDILFYTGMPLTTTIGGNSASVGTTMYNPITLGGLPSASFDNINWLDKKVWVSDPIDLSGAATNDICFDSVIQRFITKIEFVYTEASSSDTGIDVLIRHVGASGTSKTAYTYTTEVSKSLYYTKTLYLPDLGVSNARAIYNGYENYVIVNPGGKTGTGEFVVRIEYVENFGALL